MAKHKSNLLFITLLAAGDLLMINLAFLSAYWFRFYAGVIPLVHGITSLRDYYHLLVFVSIVLLLTLRSFGLYATRRRFSRIDEFFVLVKAVTISMLLLVAMTFFYREFSYSRVLILLAWVLSIPFLNLSRFFIDNLELWLRRVKKDSKRLLIVGTDKMAERLLESIKKNPRWNYETAGFLSCDHSESRGDISDVPILGMLEDLPGVLDEEKFDEVILTKPGLAHEKIVNCILECEKRMVTFKLVPDLLGVVTSRVDTQSMDGITLLGLRESPLHETYNRFLKRSMDIAGSAMGLLILGPMLLVIAALIKRGSKGPVFYRQERIGEDGRGFLMYKFRTMRPDAEKGTGPVWAKEGDPRRTKIGKKLRKRNLDELPQLINVLKGEMSLVGPRPERPHFVGQFKEDIPRYMSRHKIKSGMTGWAQVNGLRGDTSIEERTKYDLFYIENWSLLLDIKILFMSLFAVKNAY